VGSSSSIPRPCRACSSYLIEDEDLSLVLDLGSGAFGNLREHAEYDRLDAVVISHMHADHFIDLIPMRYALRYGALRRKDKVPLYLPPDGERMLSVLVSSFADEGAGEFIGAVFDVRTYDPSAPLRIGPGTVRFAHTAHYIPAFAMRYDAHGRSVTYSADTAPEPRVVELARETDLFICEATLLAGNVETGYRGHSTGAEAGEMAAAAGAGTLLLTHYPEFATPDDLERAAAKAFSGSILVADDHARFSVDCAATLRTSEQLL
jgi:ribonuclease BN (tRNA processing enzyme)